MSKANDQAATGTSSKPNLDDSGMEPHPPPPNVTNDIGIEPFPKLILATVQAANGMSKLIPNPQPVANIHQMSFHQRQSLVSGLGLYIYVGNEWACKVPWRLFQTVSTKVSEVDATDISHLAFRLPDMSKDPLFYIHEWLKAITTTNRVLPIKHRDNLAEDLAVVRAGKLLGMDRYVQHIFNYYWMYIRHEIPSYEEIDAILRLALSKEDPFFLRVARRLGYLKLYRKITDEEVLDSYIAKHPWLSEAVQKAIGELEVLREEKRARAEAGEDVGDVKY